MVTIVLTGYGNALPTRFLPFPASGSPYQTAVYTGLTPIVSTIHAILSINGKPAAAGGSVTGKRFALVLNSGEVKL